MKKTVLCLVLALALLCSVPAAAQPQEAYNWYEVFVYSFKDSDGDGIGDLPGLTRKLDYIRGLGFTALWLMPIMPSPSYHKYDVTDYYGIDPQYGTLEDARALVAACRERGMRLIIDLPLNHSSTQHPWFLEAAQALRDGRTEHPRVDWYHFTQEPGKNYVRLPGTDWYYEEQFQGGGMPDLNVDNASLRAEIVSILNFWLNDVGVDGFRLDAVTSFYTGDDDSNIAFLRFLKETCEALKPGSFLVGECWAGLPTIARYYESGIDSFFLFPASQAEGYIAATLRARKPAQTFINHLQRLQSAIPEGILTPFLSNHDTGRTVGLVQGRQAPERVKFAHALLSLLGGYTFTYYGEEVGMAGAGEDPNKRLGMPWAPDDITSPPPGVTREEYPYPDVAAQQADPFSILNYIRTLNTQRLDLPEVALGQTEVHQASDDTCVIIRQYQGRAVWIAVNFSPKASRDLRLGARLKALHMLDVGETVTTVTADSQGTLVRLAPYGIAYLGPAD